MTRKHYIAIAEALLKAEPYFVADRHEQYNYLVHDISDALQEGNKLFNPKMFIAACQPKVDAR
jgi:hypothetical protein